MVLRLRRFQLELVASESNKLSSHATRLWFWARIATMLLIVRVTVGVVMGYVDYLPPNFYSAFLSGRQGYFHGPYQIAFWIHIVVSPLVMFSGLWLLSDRMRRRYRAMHRWLGRTHTLAVLLLVAPSGLWMSFYALTGAWAGSAFAISSCATFFCASMGWQKALAKNFAEHQIWMTRSYLLLCSAVVLRVLSGAATLLQCDLLWTYPLFAWLSTIVPICIYELSRRFNRIFVVA